MVARLKLKGIDGRAPPGVEPAALINNNQLGRKSKCEIIIKKKSIC